MPNEGEKYVRTTPCTASPLLSIRLINARVYNELRNSSSKDDGRVANGSEGRVFLGGTFTLNLLGHCYSLHIPDVYQNPPQFSEYIYIIKNENTLQL